jgi:hypothetical protein
MALRVWLRQASKKVFRKEETLFQISYEKLPDVGKSSGALSLTPRTVSKTLPSGGGSLLLAEAKKRQQPSAAGQAGNLGVDVEAA